MCLKNCLNIMLVVVCAASLCFGAGQPVKSADQVIAEAGGDPVARKKLEGDMVALLKSDATLLQKQRALRILAVVGTTDSVEVLAGLLGDENLGHMARYALEPMPYPEVGSALRDALGKTSGQAKVGVIQSIGVRRDKEAVAVLIGLLGDSDTKIAAAAAWALGRTGTARAADVLAELYANGPDKLRSAALDALLTAADGLVEQGAGEAAAEIYEQLQAAGGSRHVRMSAFSGLLRARPDSAVSILLKTMADDDPAMRRLAIANIATLEGANVSKRFAAELPKLSPDAQVLLIDALTQRRDPVVVPAITAAASSKNVAVRASAVKALGDIGDASSVEVMVDVMAADKADVAGQEAAAGLRRLGAEGTVDAIVKSMKASKGPLRASLIDVLRDRNATGTVPVLLSEAASNDSKVRGSALKALADMAGPADLPALVKLLVDMKSEQGRKQAQRPVVAVSVKIEDEGKRADATLKALRSAKDTATRCSLLRVLSGIGNDRALAAVSDSLADGSAVVQDAAVRALADWPNAKAVGKLVDVYSTTGNRTHRVVALRGSVRLLGQGGLSAGETLAACQTLMKGAKSTQEKKLVLGRLANVADAAAVEMVEPLLANEQVKAEAELALAQIARGIMGTSPDEAKSAAEKLLKTSKNKAIRDEASGILKQIEKFGGYVIAWQFAGPYRKDGNDYIEIFDAVFPPEQGDGAGANWKILPVGGGDRPWMFNPGSGANCLGYARTWIYSDKERDAQLQFGTDDGSKVWLNGKVVHANSTGGAAIPDEHKVNVTLRRGSNRLLLKVTQGSGPWQFCLRITKPDGSELKGVKAQANPGQK